jgi:phage tail tape-measure protein
MDEREAIEPLLADEETDRTRQRAAGVGAVVGAILGGRRGPVEAGLAAGAGGAVGYILGDLLGGTGSESTDDEPSADDGPVEIDIDGDDEE